MRRVESVRVQGVRRKGRPRRTWDEQLRLNMAVLGISRDMTSDKSSWRSKIRIAD